jgi:hypothetical protein
VPTVGIDDAIIGHTRQGKVKKTQGKRILKWKN